MIDIPTFCQDMADAVSEWLVLCKQTRCSIKT
jgi:hypothetical protein